MFVEELCHVVIHLAAHKGAGEVFSHSRASTENSLIGVLKDPVTIPMKEHPSIAIFGAEKVCVLSTIHREGIPVSVIAANGGIEGQHVGIGDAVECRLISLVFIEKTSQFDKASEVIVGFAGAHDPLAMIGDGVFGVFVRPVGIAALTAVAIVAGEAPLVVNSKKSALVSVGEVPLQEII